MRFFILEFSRNEFSILLHCMLKKAPLLIFDCKPKYMSIGYACMHALSLTKCRCITQLIHQSTTYLANEFFLFHSVFFSVYVPVHTVVAQHYRAFFSFNNYNDSKRLLHTFVSLPLFPGTVVRTKATKEENRENLWRKRSAGMMK